MKNIEILKKVIASELFNGFKEAFEQFSGEDFDLIMLGKIDNLSPECIARAVGIQKPMAFKYKSGENLPPLEKAVILEDLFDIPARYWVLNREKKRNVHS
jgi:hypothetical protein